jgi:formylglycine-generating enzyme required for sulfatase activity
MYTAKMQLTVIVAIMVAFNAFGAENSPAPTMKGITAGKIEALTCSEGKAICPEHELMVRIVEVPAFQMAETEVTFAQWDECIKDGGCAEEASGWAYKNRPVHPPCVEGKACRFPFDEGWGRDQHPVIHVSWNDIQKYLQWLNTKTASNYRLPSSEEWEYAALAGASTTYDWGDELGKNKANCEECGSKWDNKQTAPVASFKPNRFGLHDMNGNVSEWVSNCFPTREKGSQSCMTYMYRGGAWSYPAEATDPRLYGDAYGEFRANFLGFRLARTPRSSEARP